jgi:hypothetical protein
MQAPARIREILTVIVCPVCYGQLALEETPRSFVVACASCGRRYPVEDGIPVLLESRATLNATPR